MESALALNSRPAPAKPAAGKPSALVTICCACGSHLAGPILPRALVLRPPAWLAVSHGICRPCAEASLAAYGLKLPEAPRL